MRFPERGRRPEMHHSGIARVFLLDAGADIMRGLRMKGKRVDRATIRNKWSLTSRRFAGGLKAIYLTVKLGPSLTIGRVLLQELTRQFIHKEEAGEYGIRPDPLQTVGLPGAGGAGNDDTRDCGLMAQ